MKALRELLSTKNYVIEASSLTKVDPTLADWEHMKSSNHFALFSKVLESIYSKALLCFFVFAFACLTIGHGIGD